MVTSSRSNHATRSAASLPGLRPHQTGNAASNQAELVEWPLAPGRQVADTAVDDQGAAYGRLLLTVPSEPAKLEKFPC